jgi:DNA-binding transcriptional LysR family regulator
MDLEDLRTFVDVADAGGVSAAARRLGVSKSIVSRRLFRLERVDWRHDPKWENDPPKL